MVGRKGEERGLKKEGEVDGPTEVFGNEMDKGRNIG